MYPISASKELRLHEIANHCAIEIQQHNPDSLLEVLIKAWWGGEFGDAEAERRLPALRELYEHNQDAILFVVQGCEEPEHKRELPDGGVEIFRFYRVPLPSDDPSCWTQANCAEAFSVLTENWILGIVGSNDKSLSFIKLSERTFTDWARARGYDRPKFWAAGAVAGPSAGVGETETPGEALVRPSFSIHPAEVQTAAPQKRSRKRSRVLDRVILEMRRRIDEGATSLQGLYDEKEERLADSYGCSRGTARKARDQVLFRARDLEK
jgi:hypothetical protein